MQQSGLFSSTESISLPHAELTLYRGWLPVEDARDWFYWLSEHLQWRQPDIRIAGRTLPIPRLQAWYGDQGTSYIYSGKQFDPLAWLPKLAKLNKDVAETTGHEYNSVLANFYRNGEDSVAWHADDEPELGPSPVIASLSLGATRGFLLKPKAKTFEHETIRLELAEGDLLLMDDTMQQYWQHCIPKTKRCAESRINLTFRKVVDF